MVLRQTGARLALESMPIPRPGAGELRIRVHACAVCRTDLHVVDGDLPQPNLPLIPGHEVIGTVDAVGDGAPRGVIGQRVSVPWLGSTCGRCPYCLGGRENLCDRAQFTGYTRNGGFAEYLVADHRYCFPIPESYSDTSAAPLMCAGLIGFRSLAAAGDAKRLGIYGFGAAARACSPAVARPENRHGHFLRAARFVLASFLAELAYPAAQARHLVELFERKHRARRRAQRRIDPREAQRTEPLLRTGCFFIHRTST
jgi:propanol-preferring alcohol dehydrogenase